MPIQAVSIQIDNEYRMIVRQSAEPAKNKVDPRISASINPATNPLKLPVCGRIRQNSDTAMVPSNRHMVPQNSECQPNINSGIVKTST